MVLPALVVLKQWDSYVGWSTVLGTMFPLAAIIKIILVLFVCVLTLRASVEGSSFKNARRSCYDWVKAKVPSVYRQPELIV